MNRSETVEAIANIERKPTLTDRDLQAIDAATCWLRDDAGSWIKEGLDAVIARATEAGTARPGERWYDEADALAEGGE